MSVQYFCDVCKERATVRIIIEVTVCPIVNGTSKRKYEQRELCDQCRGDALKMLPFNGFAELLK